MLKIMPISFKEACEFVRQFHRHHKPPQGHKFSICAVDKESLIQGVAIIGRPVSRMEDNGLTLEVIRLCTKSEMKNVSSKLLGSAWRAVKGLGYQRLITYIRIDEKGISLKAAGFKIIGETKSANWNRPGRPRIQKTEEIERLKFCKEI